MSEIDDFLARPLLARMATTNPATLQPHVVPVWYGWDGTSLWIGTFRGTRKVKELLRIRAFRLSSTLTATPRG